jgi:hypothetical protein
MNTTTAAQHAEISRQAGHDGSFYTLAERHQVEARIVYERVLDLCPVCRVSGMAPCVDERGNDTTDHSGRPVDQASSSTGRVCAVCGEPEGSPYAKHCCTDDQMIEA